MRDKECLPSRKISYVPPMRIPANAAAAGGVSKARRSIPYDDQEEDESDLTRRRVDDAVAVSFETTTLGRTSSSMSAPTDVLTIVRGKTSPGVTSEEEGGV